MVIGEFKEFHNQWKRNLLLIVGKLMAKKSFDNNDCMHGNEKVYSKNLS